MAKNRTSCPIFSLEFAVRQIPLYTPFGGILPNVDNGHKIVRLYTGDFNMDTEHRTATAEKVLRSAYRGVQVPQEKFTELLEASVRIQDMTNQVNLLIINAAAEAVCTGEDKFAIAVNEVSKWSRKPVIKVELSVRRLKSCRENLFFKCTCAVP